MQPGDGEQADRLNRLACTRVDDADFHPSRYRRSHHNHPGQNGKQRGRVRQQIADPFNGSQKKTQKVAPGAFGCCHAFTSLRNKRKG